MNAWRGLKARIPALLLLALAACSSVPTNTPESRAQTLSAFRSGKINLDCGVPCTWGWVNERARMRALDAAGDWESLALLVAQVGYQKDLAYYYLGRAAEGLGYREAAYAYYGDSYTLATGSQPGARCREVAGDCMGVNLLAVLPVKLKSNAGMVASSAKQNTAAPVEKWNNDQKVSLGPGPRGESDLSYLANVPATRDCIVSNGLKKHPALRAAMLRDLGQKPFKKISSGWGSQGPCGEFQRFGDILTLFSCQAHNCISNQVSLFINLNNNQIQACWHDEETGQAYWIAPGAPPRPLDRGDDCTLMNSIGEAGVLAKYGTSDTMAGRVISSERLGVQIFTRGGQRWCGEEVQIDVVVSPDANYKNHNFFSASDFAALIQNLGTKILSQTCPAARGVKIRGMGTQLYVKWNGSASAALGWKPIENTSASQKAGK